MQPGQTQIVTVTTRVSRPRETSTGVPNGIDYDAELHVTDEAGVKTSWQGELTYAPDHDGDLVPYGPGLEYWMSYELVTALERPWIKAHKDLVDIIIGSLGDGPGDETFEVDLG